MLSAPWTAAERGGPSGRRSQYSSENSRLGVTSLTLLPFGLMLSVNGHDLGASCTSLRMRRRKEWEAPGLAHLLCLLQPGSEMLAPPPLP